MVTRYWKSRHLIRQLGDERVSETSKSATAHKYLSTLGNQSHISRNHGQLDLPAGRGPTNIRRELHFRTERFVIREEFVTEYMIPRCGSDS